MDTFFRGPDLTLLLDAEADLVNVRKDELEVCEIEHQLREWRALLPRAGRRVHRVDATGSPEKLLEQARELIRRELDTRHPDVASTTLPLRIAGSIARRASHGARRGRRPPPLADPAPAWRARAAARPAVPSGAREAGLFRWRTQLLVLFGAGSVDQIVASANSPDRGLAELCGHPGLDHDAPSRALFAYLERRPSAATIDPRTDDIVRQALALLDDGESS